MVRKYFINSIIGFFLFMPLFDMITLREDFPFAPYTMYSKRYVAKGYADYLLYGVTTDGEEKILMNIMQFHEGRLSISLKVSYERKNGEAQEKLEKLFSQCKENHPCLAKLQGEKKSEPISKIRFYKEIYDDIDEIKNKKPRIRRLIAEAQ